MQYNVMQIAGFPCVLQHPWPPGRLAADNKQIRVCPPVTDPRNRISLL